MTKAIRSNTLLTNVVFRSLSTSAKAFMWPSMRSWTNSVGMMDDPLAFKMRFCPNVEAIFDVLERDNNLKALEDNPNLLPVVLRNIIFKHLTCLERQYPFKVWMVPDIFMFYRQCNFCPEEFKLVWEPIHEHPTFKRVMEILPALLDSKSLTAHSSVETALLLRFFNNSDTDKSVRNSFCNARKQLRQVDYSILELYCLVNNIGRDFAVVKMLCNRIKQDLEGDVLKNSDANLLALVQVCTSVREFFSEDLFKSFADKCTEIYSLKNLSTDLDNLIKMASAMSKIYDWGDCPMGSRVAIERCFVNFIRLLSENNTALTPMQLTMIERATHKVGCVLPTTLRNSSHCRNYNVTNVCFLRQYICTVFYTKTVPVLELQ